MTTNAAERLLPCPFCASEQVSRAAGSKGGSPWVYIECEDCGATAEPERWNNRPRRLQLIESDCELRDARWSIRINSEESPVEVRVRHRQFGSWWDWPERIFDGGPPAVSRAYELDDGEVRFRTRGKALAAATHFLRRFGAGEVEYLEWDIDSQSLVVVGHEPRDASGRWWGEDKPDPIAPFMSAGAATAADEGDARG